ncbi:MAG: RNHCP domain-containing protein [Candidatus Paceibacterota bacterium]
MPPKTFQKTVENFECEHCHNPVSGNGYTNHCPACLWSKHVDINPGDRAATCGGMMKPTALENENGEYVVTHTCIKCSYKKRNKISPTDDFDVVVQVATDLAEIDSKGFSSRAPLGAGQQAQNLLLVSAGSQ